jgi:prepilin-type N-terminal cleavage/methylation domain-containing protein
MSKTAKQQGFTIIELLVATTIFSIVLMVILASFLQVGRMFYKGISINNTNESARSLVDSITNDIKLAQSSTTPITFTSAGTTAYYLCIGSHRYVYISDNHKINSDDINAPDPQAPHGVIRSVMASGCQAPSVKGNDAEQLLGPNMQLNNSSDLMGCDVGTGFCTIHAHVVFYGIDSSVFVSSAHPDPDGSQVDADNAYKDQDARCSGNLLSTQLCAVTDIITVAGLRK